MCTVTYLPIQPNEFIITSNRDETPLRATRAPQQEQHQQVTLLFPKDELAGGTWICAGSNNRVACLLNGAFERHMRQPPYRHSRGQVVLDYFLTTDTETFANTYNCDNLEPFTLVLRAADGLYELRWDGQQKHFKTLDMMVPHIWASATLYTAEYINKRREWFKQWLDKHRVYRAQDILDFHVTGGEGNVYNDIVMNRGNLVRTVSITSVVHTPQQIDMTYYDLLQQTDHASSLPI